MPEFTGYRKTDAAAIKAALNRQGFDATEADIVWAWEEYSDKMCAGWLDIGNPEDAAVTVRSFLI